MGFYSNHDHSKLLLEDSEGSQLRVVKPQPVQDEPEVSCCNTC